jgi:hypothetical protein
VGSVGSKQSVIGTLSRFVRQCWKVRREPTGRSGQRKFSVSSTSSRSGRCPRWIALFVRRFVRGSRAPTGHSAALTGRGGVLLCLFMLTTHVLRPRLLSKLLARIQILGNFKQPYSIFGESGPPSHLRRSCRVHFDVSICANCLTRAAPSAQFRGSNRQNRPTVVLKNTQRWPARQTSQSHLLIEPGSRPDRALNLKGLEHARTNPETFAPVFSYQRGQ